MGIRPPTAVTCPRCSVGVWTPCDYPEAAYPGNYDVYRSVDYRGDFGGYTGTVVYDTPTSADAQELAPVATPAAAA